MCNFHSFEENSFGKTLILTFPLILFGYLMFVIFSSVACVKFFFVGRVGVGRVRSVLFHKIYLRPLLVFSSFSFLIWIRLISVDIGHESCRCHGSQVTIVML